ncbi:MAG: cation:proton antiporter [Coriobacteriales bacterium]|jgi:Kef-type K+ transport system membrane component KefB
MTIDFISLAVIVIAAVICPIIAHLIPNKLIPESVFLLVAGCILGPNCLGLIQVDEIVSFLSDLGLAFLFLLAGMEINPKTLVDRQGRRALVTWAVSMGIALLATAFSPFISEGGPRLAVAIALTTTAFGTLVPIMKERGLNGTPVGDAITAYGTWGELAPVLAIAILLTTRAKIETLIIICVFIAICVVMAVVPAIAKKAGSGLYRFLSADANPTYQTMMRFTIMILVVLVAFSSLFDLDIVLGAFAAGFVMRYIIPEGDEKLESKLNGAAYGFFIPIFFVVSGSKVSIAAVGARPAMLVLFILGLMLIRGLPIFVSLYTDKKSALSIHNKWTVALYCTTALPLIVAVTSIAVSAGAMTQDNASVLVAAGAITVFLMPLLASLTYRIADAKPVEAIEEITHNPRDLAKIIRQHVMLERMVSIELALGQLERRKRHVTQEGESCDIDEYKELAKRKRALAATLDHVRAELGSELGGENGELSDEDLDKEIERIRAARREYLKGDGHHGPNDERVSQINDALARRAIAETRKQRADFMKKAVAKRAEGTTQKVWVPPSQANGTDGNGEQSEEGQAQTEGAGPSAPEADKSASDRPE